MKTLSIAVAVLAVGCASPAAERGPRRTIPLDGAWEFRRDGATEWKEVQVPSSFQMHEGETFHGVGWYRKTIPAFDVPAGKRAFLHFDAAATLAEVSWDGRKLGTHLGGWTPFRFDVTDAARTSGHEGGHVVEVRLDEKVGHNTQGFLPIIAPHLGGIWQSVEILVVPAPAIDDLGLMAIGNADTGRIELEVPLIGGGTAPSPAARWRLRGTEDWSPEERVVGGGIAIPGARRWSPEDPALYDVEVRIAGGDAVRTAAAFRKLETKADAILLNGTPLGIRGVLNWGYYPPENYPKVDEVRFRRDMELIRSWGFNLMKFCLWVPPKRYLEIADEEGILAWMEYPTWHPSLTQEHLADLRGEFAEFFAYDRNHPSVVLRSLTCETGAGADLAVIQDLYDTAHRMIPGCLVVDDSSWIGWNRIMDFYDDHPYGNNHTWVATLKGFRDFIAEKKRTLPLVLGEAIAADSWVPREPLLAKVGDARPFWVPGFFDDSGRWLDRMRGLYGAGGLDRLVPDSLRYDMLMRKYQVEAYRREIPAGGYVISVMRDFSLAAMGLLDYHDQPKWSSAEWGWQGDTCILLATESDRRSFAGGERLRGEVLVSHFGRRAIRGGRLEVSLTRDAMIATVSAEGPLELEPGMLRKALDVDLPLPEIAEPEPFVLRAILEMDGGEVRNEWELWLVPSVPEPSAEPEGIVLARRFDDAIVETLEKGGKVFLQPDGGERSLPLNAHWFLRGAPYVPDHPVTGTGRRRRLLVDLQHFDLASDVIPEVGYLDQIDPVLLLWDTHDRKVVGTHGLIWEARAGKGRLLVSAVRHDGPTNAAGRWLRSVLLEHLASGPEPRRGLSEATWARIQARLHEETIDLVPETWKLKPDPRDEGLEEGWHLPTLAIDDSWKDVKVGAAWESQGWPDLDEWAWYRLAKRIPAAWEGRDVYLSFQGVDDCYELYVNGKLAGKGGDLAARKDAFSERRSHRITDLVKDAEECVIAVRVHDWYGAGGIHRPVSLSTVPFHDGPEVLKP